VQHALAELGILREKADQRVAIEALDLGFGREAHGGVARAADERPDLADELAGFRDPDRARRAIELVAHLRFARQDAVREAARLAVAEQRRTRLQLDVHRPRLLEDLTPPVCHGR